MCRYWDIEARLVPVSEKTDFCLNPHDAIKFIDENTIGVMIIMGSTYTGHFEDVQLMSDLRTSASGPRTLLRADRVSGSQWMSFRRKRASTSRSTLMLRLVASLLPSLTRPTSGRSM